MFEVDFLRLFKLPVHKLQLLIELHLILDQQPHADHDVLDLLVKVDLLNFDTAEVLHLLGLHRTTVDASAQTVDVYLGRKQHDYVRGKCERLKNGLIESWKEVLYLYVLVGIKAVFCQVGL